jgi:GAF domain-containing protein
MMNRQSAPVEMDQVQAGRVQVARMVILVSMIAAVVILVVFVNLLFTSSQPSNRYMVVVALAFIVLSGISLWFIRRQQLNRAVVVYVMALIVCLTTAIYLLGGVTGPVTIGFVMAVVIAGLIGGIKSLRQASIIVGVIYLVMAILEATQVLHPESIPAASSWLIEIIFFLAVFSVTALVAGVFINQTESAFAAERQRGLELVEASRQAEQSATAERELREREAHSAIHLRETVAGYVDYLSRVAAGEYTARVDVGELEEDVEGDRELHALGAYLNTTVDALVAALTQARETQRRYTEQTWQTVVESGRVQPGFAYRQNQITPEVGWLPQMTRAVNSAVPVAEGEGAAVPLVVNRQVVGAIGGEHPDGRPWTDEELSLIEDVTGQLAQTIESLRLFDDVQRRAVQEQLVGEVTTRIRESLDVETVLKTAAQEIRRSLGLDKISIHLGIFEE